MQNYNGSIKIIHLVNNLDKINFGIWNAAVFASEYIHDHFNVSSFLWTCSEVQKDEPLIPGITIFYLGEHSTSKSSLSDQVHGQGLTPNNTIFISHGCWQTPTRLGFKLQKLGFIWVSAPHGMLEPWSMQHKKWKKLIYFLLIEKRLLANAQGIRAVSETERRNLQNLFGREIYMVENGVSVPAYKEKVKGDRIFLFMARLHHKKGILPLVNAWINSMMRTAECKLIIAGPDEGELIKIQPFLRSDNTIEYVGPVYGTKKQELLEQAHYFVLPSYSEGFPTSVVEAMAYGLIPLISSGCNFSTVFTENLGYQLEPNDKTISDVLNKLKIEFFNDALSIKNHDYIKKQNSEEAIGKKLMEMYTRLLSA